MNEERTILVQPFWLRFLLWVFAGSVIVLVATGFYIAYPFSWRPGTGAFLAGPGWQNSMRLAHFVAAMAGIGAYTGRIYAAIAAGDWRLLVLSRQDILHLPKVFAYETFLTESKPPQMKYNAGQKLLFTSWLVTFPIEIITGSILLSPVNLGTLARLFGDLQGVRWVHHLTALWFLASGMVHTYLSLTEDPARLRAIFLGSAEIKVEGRGRKDERS